MIDRAYIAVFASLSFALGALARDVAQDWRDMKAEAAAPRKAQTEPAPIWSKNCQKASGFLFASQADGGKWKVRCHQPRGTRA